MFLADLELFLVELPASDGAVRTLLVRVADEAGQEGWGETRTAWHASELAARRNSLLAVLAGRAIHDVEATLADDILADRAVACGIEMALWDLIARAARQPLCHLLGGAYRSSVPLAIRLWQGSVENVVHWARTFAAQGIASQTITSTGVPETDVQLVSALRDACSQRVRFRLDARGQYDSRAAARLCSELEPESVEFVLDPLADGHTDWLFAVRTRSKVPLGCYDAIASPADVLHLARTGNVSHVLVDPVRVGGLTRARACAAVAEAAGMGAGVRILGTSGLALAATLQIAAATPAFGTGHECSYPQLHDDILTEPVRTSEGMLTVPMGPGLGVEIDRDKVEWYQVNS
jgi:L-alanine-DL-glutamate epimerase-like enolase superfamily enzyme